LGPRVGLDAMEKRKNLLLLPGIKHRFPGHAADTLLAITNLRPANPNDAALSFERASSHVACWGADSLTDQLSDTK
jgi:hypothetical protein